MLTDTHIHFDGLMAEGDTIGAIMERAFSRGISRMIAIGGSPAANRTALEIACAYPEHIRAVVGFNRDQTAVVSPGRLVRHSPDSPKGRDDGGSASLFARPLRRDMLAEPGDPMDELEAMLAAPEIAAVGEIGLDFHHGRETALAQIELFQRMLLLARDHRLPVSVHTREAEAETLAALCAHAAAWRGAPDRIGVMHCFTGGEVFARDLLALGFMISFSGIITFKNAGGLLAVAALVPEDRLLIETDSPYLAPEPFRGQPNEPSHVRRVAETLSAIRHTSWETIAEITTRNADKMFFWQD